MHYDNLTGYQRNILCIPTSGNIEIGPRILKFILFHLNNKSLINTGQIEKPIEMILMVIMNSCLTSGGKSE